MSINYNEIDMAIKDKTILLKEICMNKTIDQYRSYSQLIEDLKKLLAYKYRTNNGWNELSADAMKGILTECYVTTFTTNNIMWAIRLLSEFKMLLTGWSDCAYHTLFKPIYEEKCLQDAMDRENYQIINFHFKQMFEHSEFDLIFVSNVNKIKNILFPNIKFTLDRYNTKIRTVKASNFYLCVQFPEVFLLFKQWLLFVVCDDANEMYNKMKFHIPDDLYLEHQGTILKGIKVDSYMREYLALKQELSLDFICLFDLPSDLCNFILYDI
jgi:hypothetical protein